MRSPKSQIAAFIILVFVLAAWPVAPCAQTQQELYEQAKKDYAWLMQHPSAQKVPQNWQVLADRFTRAYKMDPTGPLAAKTLYWTAHIHSKAFFLFKQHSDFNEAVDLYRRIPKRFPESALADDAQYKIGQMFEKTGDQKRAYVEYLRVTMNHPAGDMVPEAKRRLDMLEKELSPKKNEASYGGQPGPAKPAPQTGQPTSALVSVTDLKHWSTPSYTRVVASLDRPVAYTASLLKSNQNAGKPRRLYVDLRGARMTPGVEETLPIADGLLKRARAGQFNPSTVRLVLDIKQLTSYKVFTLDNPFRVVVDCFDASGKAKAKAKAITKAAKLKVHKVKRGASQQKPPELGLAAALGLKLKRIILDPGHGGKDQGAAFGGLLEKNVTLDIARRSAVYLRKALKCEVLLTRNSDRFVPLEARTAFANTKDGDLFISIHVNAAPSRGLSGIETYFLNLATDAESMRVAARENATTRRSISDLQVILNDLMLHSKINESNRLARAVHGGLLEKLRRHYRRVNNLKVKQAPFYVLIGARMPAILMEVGFITNRAEHKRLSSTSYRDRVALGIARGVRAYAKALSGGKG